MENKSETHSNDVDDKRSALMNILSGLDKFNNETTRSIIFMKQLSDFADIVFDTVDDSYGDEIAKLGFKKFREMFSSEIISVIEQIQTAGNDGRRSRPMSRRRRMSDESL